MGAIGSFQLPAEASSKSLSPATLCMISGNGRSGSNRLLDILDLSEITACRNEPDEINGGRLSGFGFQLFNDQLQKPDIVELHRELIAAGYIRSDRDRFNRSEKQFLTPIGKSLLPVMARRKLRTLAHTTGLMRNPLEWKLPQVAINDNPILPIVKLNARPIWAEQVAKIEPGLRIVHNIRQPWKFLNSWYNRFILNQDTLAASFTEHFADVPLLLEYYGRNDSARLREGNLENIVEVELWRWRYVNERLMKFDTENARYLRVTYEDIDANPVSAAHQVYEFLDLDLSPKVEEDIANLKNTLFAKPHKNKLDTILVSKLMTSVLAESPLDQAFKGGLVMP